MERFLHDLLFECDSPSVITEYLGVAIDTAKQVQTYVISQRYEGLVRQ